ncbi:MAG: FAD-binding oxidoreductase [Alphaproteobacteria bacterium]|nr:FAD-binding oxidoreductase [Alphaproteobacteria bacterium]
MKIGIVGGGIVGVTTGVVLREAGHEVTIFSRDPHTKTTSWAAAAISCPVSVEDSPRVNRWFAQTNAVLENLQGETRAGISRIEWRKFSVYKDCPTLSWMDHMQGARLLGPEECAAPYHSGVFAPHFQMVVDLYYPYMLARFKDAGGVYEIKNVEGLEALSGPYDVLVNATGVYARDFVGDESVSPASGQVVIVKNNGVTHHSTAFETKNYIYPRGETCLLGGSFDPGVWDMKPDPALSRSILDWAADYEPRLRNAEVLDVRVGLRPLRPEVRLEQEILTDGTVVIHNYGHGGSGYTLSWGCAFDILQMLQSA